MHLMKWGKEASSSVKRAYHKPLGGRIGHAQPFQSAGAAMNHSPVDQSQPMLVVEFSMQLHRSCRRSLCRRDHLTRGSVGMCMERATCLDRWCRILARAPQQTNRKQFTCIMYPLASQAEPLSAHSALQGPQLAPSCAPH